MSWKSYLNEVTNKSKVIDIHTFNLSKLYSDFNRKYFDNKLPVVPVVLKKLKNYGGITQLRGIKQFGRIKSMSIDYIAISTFLETTEERLYGILVHEMCHVWVHMVDNVYNDRGGQHGLYFKDIFYTIQKKTPFTIPLNDDTVGLEISGNVKAKQLYVVLRTHLNVSTTNKKYSVMLFSKPIPNSDLVKLKTHYTYPTTEKLDYYNSNEKQLLKYTIKRKLTITISFQFIDDDLAELIKRNGKYLDSIHPSEEKDAINVKSKDLQRLMLKYAKEKDPVKKAGLLHNIKNF